MPKRQAGERAAQRSVHQRSPATVHPVHAQHAFRPWRQRRCFLGQLIKVLFTNQLAQPIEAGDAPQAIRRKVQRREENEDAEKTLKTPL